MNKSIGLAMAVVALLPGSAPAEESVAISAVKVEKRTSTVGKTKGNDYLSVAFTATINEAVPPRRTVLVKAKVKVGDEVRIDDFRALGRLEDLAPGSKKHGSVPLFMTEGLPGRPESAELTFYLVKTLEKTGPRLAEFCWRDGAVKSGPCE